ncbi:hypothetical protein RRG08_006755 [Elysia crispata]|uniref:Uncharacterized protein n=1 Tax=Elysia crispata TaxID=231223 RepID=A0AAE0ZNC6_9GAST|nr:hypothetical protein RRG08_006755 [Elysia crispata]
MDTDQGEEDEAIRPSLAMLIKSHVYFESLGKELSVEDDEEDDDEYILSAFEQCVFCLYNHPNKRRRARAFQPSLFCWDKLTRVQLFLRCP